MLDIVKYPSPVLRKKSSDVDIVGDDERCLFGDMLKTMQMSRGLGIAAPQVGINKKMVIVQVADNKLLKMVNPRILEAKGQERMEEGCLSIPNLYVNVRRSKWVKVQYVDENGKKQTLEAKGLLARAILHEIDHLNGKLIADYLNPIIKFFVLRKTKQREGTTNGKRII
ncbi:MAG: peptide deformylase [Candidatus Omnitrophica bacterium]|nr:peptide deformylase [Candidatus Omnitrophota bacterium]